jgi:hypothetical protein
LEIVRRGGIDLVLAESLDRFSRDQEHIASIYKQVTFSDARIVTLAEGEVNELHIGLKGTMGALFLRDLALKTHRGLEGRVRQGRAPGVTPYGYDRVHAIRPDGEPERGLREINPIEAAIVERIFRDYAAGRSSLSIARALNDENIPGPSGGIWRDAVIRGRASLADGMLRNELYIGRLVWNRGGHMKDPLTGTRQRRAKDPSELVICELPDLRIIDDLLWQRVQARLVQTAAASREAPSGAGQDQNRFWDHRRPKHLLSGKVICGACGTPYLARGGDYIGCGHGRQGACRNVKLIHRRDLQAHVLNILGSRLMNPELFRLFVAAFTDEWNRLAAEQQATGQAEKRELQQLTIKIANLVDLLADGRRSQALETRLAALEARQAELFAATSRVDTGPIPILHADLSDVYRSKLSQLEEAMQGPDATEAREAARMLIDQVIVSPPPVDDDPPGIEVVGNLAAMLRVGASSQTTDAHAPFDRVLDAFVCSVKEGPRT